MATIIKFLSIILLFFAVQSCCTLNRCNKKYPPKEVIKELVRIDTFYKTNTVRVDSIVYIKMPADTVRITKTVKIKNGIAYLDTLYQRGDYTGLWVAINNSKLSCESYLLNDSIPHIIDDYYIKVQELENIKSIEHKDTTIVKKYIPRFIWLIILALILIIGVTNRKSILRLLKVFIWR